MREITSYIEEIQVLLVQVLNIIESFTDAGFDSQLKSAQEKVEKVRLLKKELEKEYKKEEIEPFKENIRTLTKQIEEKFDNKIKEKNIEKDRIALEIEQLQNKKKLQNYRR
jgi:hypothetical protein